MNQRKVKIWTTEDQILAATDRAKRHAASRLKKSKELDEKCKETFGHLEELRFEAMKPHDAKENARLANQISSVELIAAGYKEKADIAAKSYHTAINSTLPRLGEILSAFRTQTMPAILGEHKAVVLR